MARPSKLMSIPDECYNKYNFISADIIDILNMDVETFQKVHPFVLETFSSSRFSNATLGLIYYIPYHLLKNLTPLQLSAIPANIIKKLPSTVIEELYLKYKDIHNVDYNEDMYFSLQNKNIGQSLKDAYNKPSTKEKYQYQFVSTEKETEFYKMTNMISLFDITVFIKIVESYIQKTKSFENLIKTWEVYEISPKNYAFYSLISKTEENKLYNYNEIKNYLKNNYTLSSTKFLDEIPYFCTYSEVFMRLIKKGYFTEDKYNGKKKDLYTYFRYADFPCLEIQIEQGVKKRYIFEEIEKYIQEFIETGTIPKETPKKRQINKLDYSNNSLNTLEYINLND